MQSYIIRLLLLMVPTLFVISLLVYVLISSMPGDFISAMMALPGANMRLDREALEKRL